MTEQNDIARAEIAGLKAVLTECKHERERRGEEMQDQIDRRFDAVKEEIRDVTKAIAQVRIAIDGDGSSRPGIKGAIAELRADIRIERLRITAIVAAIVVMVQIIGPLLIHWLQRGP